MKPDSKPNLKKKKKKLVSVLKLGSLRSQRGSIHWQLIAAFLKSLLCRVFRSASFAFPQQAGEHALPFTIALGIAAQSQCPGLRNPLQWPLPVESLGSNLKFHCPPQNKANVQN